MQTLENRMCQILALKIKEYAMETRQSEYEVDQMLKKRLHYSKKSEANYKTLGRALELIDEMMYDDKK